jgi:hypothetical protein
MPPSLPKTADRSNVRRKAGRPPATASSKIDAASITATALEMSKLTPLQDLSIVLVARKMEVTPALLHYYLGGRDSLTSRVMNAFYRLMVEGWPTSTGNAEQDIRQAVRWMYDQFVRYAGIASYTLLNNRFRIFQIIEEGETDYGVQMLENFTLEVIKAGCSPDRTGIYAHMLMDYAISSAHLKVAHRSPGEHRDFLKEQTDRLDPAKYPGITFTRGAIVDLDAEASFEEGLRLFLIGLREEKAAGK